ncbi:hypothetical protein QQS21_011545 [Conoideocrella luteorostrata]|uniref:Uncharacterized protein n=1 Tax=Conoideocrella luteorostrata TaxID=1105319 RepID=A0AAJ0FVS9_9HYPO|nr:hypothetical protein QQS21_011545 [Conoideocrella luteorostrata]
MTPRPPRIGQDKAPFLPQPSPDTMDEDPGAGSAAAFNWMPSVTQRSSMAGVVPTQPAKTAVNGKRSMPSRMIPTLSSPMTGSHEQLGLLTTHLSKVGSEEVRRVVNCNVRRSQDESRPSSVSTCGDLEGPHRITPQKTRNLSIDELQRDRLQQEQPFGPSGCSQPYRHHSRSRTSNISVRRASAHKQYPKVDPERKMLLMHQVARYWNECFELADEEKAQVKADIDQLHNDLRGQQQKLQEAHQDLDKERSMRYEMQQSLKGIEEKNSQTCQEKRELAEKVGVLKNELDTSKERVAALDAKSQSFRMKLNETIAEQQRLFRKAKEFYNRTIREVSEENKARKTESEAIEAALADSLEKRQQMKLCLEKLQSGLEQQLKEKEDEISQLKEKSFAQEQALLSEKKISEQLRSQVDAGMAAHSTAMKELASSVELLHDSIATKVLNQPQDHEMAKHFYDNLQNFKELAKHFAADVSARSDVGSLMQSLQETISAEITPALCSIHDCQKHTNETLAGIANGCLTELGFVRAGLGRLAQQQVGMSETVAENHNSATTVIETIGDDLRKTQEVCGNIGHTLESWAKEERHLMSEERSSWKKNTVLLLVQRSERIDALERKFDAVIQSYVSKFDLLNDSLATKNEAKQMIQHAMDEFRHVLDHGLSQEKAKAEHDSKQTQFTLNNVEVQISTIIDQLKRVEAQKPYPMGPDDRDKDIAKATSSLQQKIHELEAEAKVTEDLRNRWHSDIEMVNSMRSSLKTVQDMVPQIDRHNQEFSKIAGFGNILENTSRYMAQEHKWIKRYLRELTAGSTGIETSVIMTPPLTGTQQNQSSQRIKEHDGSEWGCHGLIPAHDSSAENNSTTPSQNGLLEATTKRVQVQSPLEAYSALSLSAPSVQQEQKRRRDPVKVRPILKSNASSSSQESTGWELCNEAETELGPIQERKRATSVLSSASQKIIHEISSGFITEKTNENISDLPRVTDFEPHPGAPDGASIPQMREVGNQQDKEGPESKRVKLSDESITTKLMAEKGIEIRPKSSGFGKAKHIRKGMDHLALGYGRRDDGGLYAAATLRSQTG